ncbi:MAG TPA: hypothetical protein VGF45_17515 [Polyangia bacterium]
MMLVRPSASRPFLVGVAAIFAVGSSASAIAQEPNQPAPPASTAVSWSAVLAGPGPGELAQALSRPFGNPFEARRPGGTPKLVRSCADMLGLPEGYGPAGTDADQRGFAAQAVRCRVIRLLLDAKPARESHVDGFALADDGVFRALPASMIPVPTTPPTPFMPPTKPGPRWAARDPKTKIVGVRGDRVVSEGPAIHVNLTLLGRADVDGDGLLDVIVERVGTTRDARWSATQAFVLTKRKPNEPLEAIARID